MAFPVIKIHLSVQTKTIHIVPSVKVFDHLVEQAWYQKAFEKVDQCVILAQKTQNSQDQLKIKINVAKTTLKEKKTSRCRLEV